MVDSRFDGKNRNFITWSSCIYKFQVTKVRKKASHPTVKEGGRNMFFSLGKHLPELTLPEQQSGTKASRCNQSLSGVLSIVPRGMRSKMPKRPDIFGSKSFIASGALMDERAKEWC